MAIHRHSTRPQRLTRQAAQLAQFRLEVLRGLRQSPKTLPCKYFYDEHGSALFDAICQLDEYYVTRTELAIMQQSVAAMAEVLGPGCVLIEFGSGSSVKTRLLLDHLPDLVGYVPVDISRTHLLTTASRLRNDYPHLPIHPVAADFTKSFTLPQLTAGRRVVYFPGSTIGNFTPAQAAVILARIVGLVGEGGGLLIGVDLQKDVTVLERAYADAQGVTAAFNLNLLRRINRELGGNFRVESFHHRAIYNPSMHRIEMYLVCEQPQTVQIGPARIELVKGESIHTENSHKYTVEQFARLAQRVGLSLRHSWQDERQYFSVQYYEVPA
jgi:L-histidine N-alpha-methyltransferase